MSLACSQGHADPAHAARLEELSLSRMAPPAFLQTMTLRSVPMLLDFRVFLQPKGCAPTASRVLVRGGTVEMRPGVGSIGLDAAPDGACFNGERGLL
jgi:hypothetical protein